MARVRHKKRGTTYEVLGEAEVQLSTFQTYGIKEGDKLIVYRSEADGKLWLRLASEFTDGRFEVIDD
jgi:hypothetical protein